MVSSNEYGHPADSSKALPTSITVGRDYLAAENHQAFERYKLSRAIANEIITTLAEAGIASEHELKALLAATGIDVNLPDREKNRETGTEMVCPSCARQI